MKTLPRACAVTERSVDATSVSPRHRAQCSWSELSSRHALHRCVADCHASAGWRCERNRSPRTLLRGLVIGTPGQDLNARLPGPFDKGSGPGDQVVLVRAGLPPEDDVLAPQRVDQRIQPRLLHPERQVIEAESGTPLPIALLEQHAHLAVSDPAGVLQIDRVAAEHPEEPFAA